MIRTCRWTLDTCGCILDQQYDDADYAGTMQVSAIKRCEFHSGLSTADAVTHCVGQNRRKNEAEGRLQQFFPDAKLVTWNFSGAGTARILTVQISGLTAAEAAQIANWADARFGAGRLIVERV